MTEPEALEVSKALSREITQNREPSSHAAETLRRQGHVWTPKGASPGAGRWVPGLPDDWPAEVRA